MLALFEMVCYMSTVIEKKSHEDLEEAWSSGSVSERKCRKSYFLNMFVVFEL